MRKIHYLQYFLLAPVIALLLSSEAPPPTSPPALTLHRVSALEFPLSTAASPAQSAGMGIVTVNGQDWVSQAGSGNSAGRNPGAYAIRPGGEDDLAYAMYTADTMAINRPTSMSFSVSPCAISPGGEDDLPLNYWVGLSNYTDYAWEWHGPYTSAQSFTLNCISNNSRYITAAGKFSYVVLCDKTQGMCGAEVQSGAITTLVCSSPGYYVTKPHYAPLLSVIQNGPTSVALSWTHISDPNNLGANAATSYQIYRKKVGDSSTTLIGTIAAPNASFVDPTNDVPGTPPLQPGQSYNYYLRAVNGVGTTALEAWPVVALH